MQDDKKLSLRIQTIKMNFDSLGTRKFIQDMRTEDRSQLEKVRLLVINWVQLCSIRMAIALSGYSFTATREWKDCRRYFSTASPPSSVGFSCWLGVVCFFVTTQRL